MGKALGAGVAAAVVLASTVLAGCSAPTATGPISPGPFGPSFDEMSSCAPNVKTVYFGARTITNTSDVPQRIDEVALAHNNNLVLQESWIVPGSERGGYLFSAASAQASYDGTRQKDWQNRREAVGAVVAPGSTYELVLKVARKDMAFDGSFRGVTMAYSGGEQTYTRTENRWGAWGKTNCDTLFRKLEADDRDAANAAR